MVIEFSVNGLPAYEYKKGRNRLFKPADPQGNPLPKLKMTGRQHWMPKAQRYVAWKKHVVTALFKSFADNSGLGTVSMKEIREFVDMFADEKPIITGKRKVHMDIFIRWKDGKHGDPENIFGSVADSLFKQDKYLAGSFDFEQKPSGKGGVDVKITI